MEISQRVIAKQRFSSLTAQALRLCTKKRPKKEKQKEKQKENKG